MKKNIYSSPLIWALIFLGLILRTGYVLTLPNEKLMPDERDYVQSAINLLNEGSFDRTVYYHVPPGVPVLFAGLFAITGPDYRAARLFQALLFIPLGFILFSLGRELAGSAAGFLTLVGGAIYPSFIFFTGYALTETATTLAITALVLTAIQAVRLPGWRPAVLFGAILVAGALTRASIFYFVLSVPFIFILGRGIRLRAWLKPVLVTLAVFIALYTPWVLVNRYYFGEVILAPTIGGGVMLYQTALRLTIPDEKERSAFLKHEILPKYYYPAGAGHPERLAGDRFLTTEGKRLILENINQYPAVIWHNIKCFWQLYPENSEDNRKARFYFIVGLGSFGLILPLAIVGAWGIRKEFRKFAALYGFIAYFTILHALLYGKLRYRVPMDGLLIALAACGVIFLLSRFRPTWQKAVERLISYPELKENSP